MNKSRLSKRLEKQGRKNFILSLFGIIFVLFLLFKFGVPLLANFALFISGFKNTQDTVDENKTSFVPPPVLNPTFNATNSAEINISGVAWEKQTVKLYLDEEIFDEVKTQKDGSFVFENVKLNLGENSIRAKAITESKEESDFSTPLTIIFKNTPPKLVIDSPTDNQSYSKDENLAKVSGKTDPNVQVTINEFIAIVDEKGNFSYQLPLQNGENKIKVTAFDEAGNKTEAERKVNYSP